MAGLSGSEGLRQRSFRKTASSASDPDVNIGSIPTDHQWQDDKDISNCNACNVEFDLFIRRHHCRACGKIFCAKCTSQSAVVEGFDYLVRVCDYCILRTVQRRRQSSPHKRESNSQQMTVSTAHETMQPSEFFRLQNNTVDLQSVVPMRGWVSNITAPKALTEESKDGMSEESDSQRRDSAMLPALPASGHQLMEAPVELCYGCFNLWGNKAQYREGRYPVGYSCSHCFKEFHRSCKLMASTAAPCTRTIEAQNKEVLHENTRRTIREVDYRAFFGTIIVTAHRAKDLKVGKWDIGTQDPCVTLSILPGQLDKVRTKPQIAGGKNPVWGRMERNTLGLQLPIQSSVSIQPYELVVEVWNSNLLSDTRLGSVAIDLLPALLHPSTALSRWHKLRTTLGEDGEDAGYIFLDIMYQRAKDLVGCDWTTHSLSLKTFYSVPSIHSFLPSFHTPFSSNHLYCNACGELLSVEKQGIQVSQGFRCSICHIHCHIWCRLAAERDFSCRPRIIRGMPRNKDSTHVGVLYLVLKGIHRCTDSCHSLFHARGDKKEEVYAVIEFEDHALKTPGCYNDGRPNLNCQVAFYVRRPTNSVVRVEVRSKQTHRAIGFAELPLYDILEAQANMYMGNLPAGVPGPFQDRPDPGGEWLLLSTPPNGKGPTGFIQLKAFFSSNVKHFFQPQTKAREEPNFSLEEMRTNLARFLRLTGYIKEAQTFVVSVWRWENKPLTLFLYFLFAYFCLYFDYSKVLVVPALACLVLLLYFYQQRKSGAFSRYWMSVDAEEKSKFAKLKVLVLRAEFGGQESGEGISLPSTLFVHLDYLPRTIGHGMMWDQHFIGRTSAQPVVGRCVSWEVLPPILAEDTVDRNGAAKEEDSERGDKVEPNLTLLDDVKESGSRKPSAADVSATDEGESDQYENEKLALAVSSTISHNEAAESSTSLRRTSIFQQLRPAALVQKMWNSSFKTGNKVSLQTWDQGDGLLNPHTFKFVIPQPSKVIQGTPELVPWAESVAELKFTLMGERNGNVGHSVVRLSELVTHEHLGGDQGIFHRWIDIVDSGDSAQSVYPPPSRGKLLVRMQLRLWSREAELYPHHDDEEEEEERLFQPSRDETAAKSQNSLLDTYRQIKIVSRNVQNTLGSICSDIESTKNLFNWTHPWKTQLVLVAALATLLIALLVPTYLVIFIAGTYRFFKRLIFPRAQRNTPLLKLIQSTPNDKDLREMHKRMRDRNEYTVRLQTKLREIAPDAVFMAPVKKLDKGMSLLSKKEEWAPGVLLLRTKEPTYDGKPALLLAKNPESFGDEKFVASEENTLHLSAEDTVKDFSPVSGPSDVLPHTIKVCGYRLNGTRTEWFLSCVSEVDKDALTECIFRVIMEWTEKDSDRGRHLSSLASSASLRSTFQSSLPLPPFESFLFDDRQDDNVVTI